MFDRALCASSRQWRRRTEANFIDLVRHALHLGRETVKKINFSGCCCRGDLITPRRAAAQCRIRLIIKLLFSLFSLFPPFFPLSFTLADVHADLFDLFLPWSSSFFTSLRAAYIRYKQPYISSHVRLLRSHRCSCCVALRCPV